MERKGNKKKLFFFFFFLKSKKKKEKFGFDYANYLDQWKVLKHGQNTMAR